MRKKEGNMIAARPNQWLQVLLQTNSFGISPALKGPDQIGGIPDTG